jgi:hypothetical protein
MREKISVTDNDAPDDQLLLGSYNVDQQISTVTRPDSIVLTSSYDAFGGRTLISR